MFMTLMNPVRRSGSAITFRTPCAEDGPAVTALIAACPPLDPNSAYCNLLQCTHFADTCIIAERDDEVAGWISGYQLPADPSRYFLWQVAVSASARGEGLAGRMLDALLMRPAMESVTHLITTVTDDNEASWGLFRSFAERRSASLRKSLCFDRDAHFAGQHASEWQAEIGPFSAAIQS
ncbi:MAG: diaminobutyrate acetyltransferase [Sphingobium sp.]